jgi:hypothetical protein
MRRLFGKSWDSRRPPARWKVGLFIVIAVAIFAGVMTKLSIAILPSEQTTEEHK